MMLIWSWSKHRCIFILEVILICMWSYYRPNLFSKWSWYVCGLLIDEAIFSGENLSVRPSNRPPARKNTRPPTSPFARLFFPTLSLPFSLSFFIPSDLIYCSSFLILFSSLLSSFFFILSFLSFFPFRPSFFPFQYLLHHWIYK